MTSSISAIASGQNANSKLAATGKDDGSHQDTAARNRETFQSVMAEKSRTEDQARNNAKNQRPGKANAKTDDARQSKNAGAPEKAPEEPYIEEAEVSAAPEPADAKEYEGQADFNDTDAVKEETDAATALESPDVADAAASNPEAGSGVLRGPETGVPLWFSTTQAVVSATVRNTPSGAASQVNGIVTPGQSPEIAATSPITDVLPVPGNGQSNTPGQTGEAADLKENPAVAAKSGNANIAALANAPGQAVKQEKQPEHVAARREAADDLSAPLATQRSTKPAIAAAPPPPAQTALAQSPTVLQDKPGTNGDVRWLSEVSFSADVAASEMPATSRLQQATLLQQPDLPRNVAVQLAQAMRQGGAERPMEIVLNPAELGRVRISMQAGDGAMTVHVLAERPETLDLMRRHIDVLAQEFHDIGYGTAEFAFGQNAPEGDGPSDQGSDTNQKTTAARTGEPGGDGGSDAQPHLSIHTDRVDIRL